MLHGNLKTMCTWTEHTTFIFYLGPVEYAEQNFINYKTQQQTNDKNKDNQPQPTTTATTTTITSTTILIDTEYNIKNRTVEDIISFYISERQQTDFSKIWGNSCICHNEEAIDICMAIEYTIGKTDNNKTELQYSFVFGEFL